MLEICKHFFDDLNKKAVRYCHWKSNSHLDAAVNGRTDIDILVSKDDQEEFEAVMTAFDFKRILSQPDKQFRGFEDYLGFDLKTGRFVHLHVHYRLVLGQQYIKNHRLPLEQLYFDNLIQRQGVNIPCAELELIILIIRAHVKTDLISLLKHAIKDLMGARYTAFPRDIENEFRELHKDCDADKFSLTLQQSGLPLPEEFCTRFLDRFLNDNLRFHHILLGQIQILRWLRPYRRRTGIGVYVTYLRLFILNSRLASRFRPPKRKTMYGSGAAISVVGADGSGKSTLIKDLDKWLSWKLTVRQYYYGIPKNAVSKLSSLTMRVFNKIGLKSFASSVLDVFWIYVARYRKSVSEKIIRDREKGRVVITDRFPLHDFRSMQEAMDNPRIDPDRKLLGKNLRLIEESYYDAIELPDKIVVLQVHIDELRRRKSDIELDKHELKAEAVNRIVTTDVISVVDANRPYDEVLLQVKTQIWNAL